LCKRQMLVFVVLGLLVILMAAPQASAKKELRVQLALPSVTIRYINNNVLPDFEKAHDVTVLIDKVNWITRQEKLLITTAGGVAPDVFMNGAQHILDLVETNLVSPLDREFATWRDRSDFFPPAFGSSTWKGTNYGVPLYVAPRLWWYRTDFFDTSGLDAANPPATWSQLLAAAKKLTLTESNSVIRQGYDLSRWTGKASASGKIQDYVVYLWQNGGDLFDERFEPLFQKLEGLETLQYLIQLKEAVRPPGFGLSLPGGSGDPILRGAAGIALTAGGTATQVYQVAPELVGAVRAILPVPGNKHRVTAVFSDWLAIHTQSQNKELAWEFIKTLTSPTILMDIDAEQGLISPRRSTVSAYVRRWPLVQSVYDALDFCRPFPVYPRAVDVAQAWADQYSLAIEGELAAHTALEEAARQWKAILAQN
jgi:multiple sugar transport system substrate-binding protein